MMNRVLLSIALSMFLWVHVSFILAQEPDSEQQDQTSIIVQQANELANELRSDVNSQASRSVSTQLPQQYVEWRIEFWQKAYGWQHISSILIFFVVVAVVGAGVALAAWQLQSWLSRAEEYDKVILAALTGKSNDGTETSNLLEAIGQPGGGKMNLTRESLSVSSPYVGVVMLGLSFAFFIAYLYFVYPIRIGPSL